MSGVELSRACREQRWEEAREMITENPQSMWTARGSYGCTAAYYAAGHGNVEMLQHMLAVILRQSLQATSQGDEEEEEEQRRQMLRGAFERGDNNGDTPAHEAAFYGHGKCLAFLVEHAPSGAAVLEAQDMHGWTPAHVAALNGKVMTLDFIVRNAPSGMRGVLDVKDNKGKTPLDRASKNVKEYFTPQKIMEIGFERELELISNEFESISLPSLMFMIIRQNIEIKLYQLSR